MFIQLKFCITVLRFLFLKVCGVLFGVLVWVFWVFLKLKFLLVELRGKIYLATSNFPSEGHHFFPVAFLPKTVFRVKSFLMSTWW